MKFIELDKKDALLENKGTWLLLLFFPTIHMFPLQAFLSQIKTGGPFYGELFS